MMLTSPAQVTHVGECINLTQKSPPASFLPVAQSQPPYLSASTIALLVELPQKSLLTYYIFPLWSSPCYIPMPPSLSNPQSQEHMGSPAQSSQVQSSSGMVFCPGSLLTHQKPKLPVPDGPQDPVPWHPCSPGTLPSSYPRPKSVHSSPSLVQQHTMPAC